MTVYRIKAIFYRLIKAGFLNSAKLFEDVFWPVVDIIMIGMMGVWMQETRGSQYNVLFALLACNSLWQAFIRANYAVSVNVLEELWDRNLVNIFSTPLVIGEWATGAILLSLIKSIFATLLCALVCLIFYATNIFALGWLLLLGIVWMFVFGVTLGFFGASFVLYGGQRYQSAIWTMGWLCAPFCAVFYPLNVMPLWMQYVGLAFPPTYLFESIRSFLFTGHYSYGFLAIGFALNLLFFVGAFLLFVFAFEKSRNLGLARLE